MEVFYAMTLLDNIYTVGCGFLQMASEPIIDPDVGGCLVP